MTDRPRKIEFIAGYHEWDVYVDGELQHAFDDVSEEITAETTKEEVDYIVQDLVALWEACPLTAKERSQLITTMAMTLCLYYGVEQ